MLPFSQICVPPINPAIADSTVIASWIIFFHTLLLTATERQIKQVEIRPLRRYIRKRTSGARKLNLPVKRAHSAQP